jgi:hypothetical protein
MVRQEAGPRAVAEAAREQSSFAKDCVAAVHLINFFHGLLCEGPMLGVTAMSSLILLIAGGMLLLAAVIYGVWRRRSGGSGADRDVFRALGTDAKSVLKRVAPPPVDLSRPIAGDVHWRAIRAHVSDAAYQRAVETVRNRYQIVGNPMPLPNTLRETMARAGLTFREAMLRVAENDGLR